MDAAQDAAAVCTACDAALGDAAPGDAAAGDAGVVDPFTVGLWRIAAWSDRLTVTQDLNSVSSETLGAPYSGNRRQQWRFEVVDGGYKLRLESTGECLLARSLITLGSCASANALWEVVQLRARTEERPALYNLRASTGACLTPNGTGAPQLSFCDAAAARVYLEPVGYGERSYPAEYEVRALLLVKPTTDVPGFASGTIAEDIVDAAQTSFEQHVARWMQLMTDGRVQWTAESIVSEEPIASLTESGGNWLPAAVNLPDDVLSYVPRGYYDTVTVFFTSGNQPGGWGWGPGSSRESNYTLWVTVNGGTTPAAEWVSWQHEPTEVFLHEPIHGYDSRYDALGLPLPEGYLHGAEINGYAREEDGWKPWYRDYWLGTVIAADDTYRGLGPRLFRLATPRQLALVEL